MASPGFPDFKLLAVDKNAAGIGAKQPEENADQRSLPGAVLAQQSVDFAFFQVESNSVVGNNSRKSLRDAINLQQFTIRVHSGRLDSRQGMELFPRVEKGADYFGQSAIFFGLISAEMIFA